MNNRIYLVFIIVLSCALLLGGAGLIGAALYLQGRAPDISAFAPAATTNGLVSPTAVAGAPQAGQLAPDFTVTNMKGEKVRLSDYRGKPVMVNFWASWCGPCTAEMKNIESVYEKHTNGDFVILGVNQGEGDDTIKGFGEIWKLNFPLLRDDGETTNKLYRIQALPTTVFIGADGMISKVEIGGPMTVEFIEQQLANLLSKVK